jgi:hypothetical protein
MERVQAQSIEVPLDFKGLVVEKIIEIQEEAKNTKDFKQREDEICVENIFLTVSTRFTDSGTYSSDSFAWPNPDGTLKKCYPV